MKHLGTKSLQTDQLILRRFIKSDAEAMFENWCNDSDVVDFLCWDKHGSVEITK